MGVVRKLQKLDRLETWGAAVGVQGEEQREKDTVLGGSGADGPGVRDMLPQLHVHTQLGELVLQRSWDDGIKGRAEVHHELTMNICTKCNGNPSNNCWDISVWTKVVNWWTNHHWYTYITKNNRQESHKNSHNDDTRTQTRQGPSNVYFRTNLWFVILGYINKIDLTWFDLSI